MNRQRVHPWLATFVPAPVGVSGRHVALSGLGAFLGLLCAAALARHILPGLEPWFIAPMGASAVLLFGVPSSPLAQPWAIVGGNVVSALIGVACARQVDDVALAAGLAVSLAVVAMFALRCLHPPSGAVALTAVLGGPAVRALGYRFVLWPVAINSLLLLMVALVFNVSARRRYPHHAPPPAPAPAPPGVTRADLDAALRARGELLDISEDDLEALFVEAERHARTRRIDDVRARRG